MFTGVGGFELGIERATTRGFRNVRYSSQEENLSNSERNKPISERQQEESNNQSSNGETESSSNASRTLFQNGQEQSNTFSDDLESTKDNSESGQQIRQASLRVLREGDGIRDDEKSLQLGEDSSNNQQFQCVGFSEIDKYANQLLAKRFPNIPNFGDCTKINASELPDFDMLCGGFPCQSFSIAGKRRGFEDTRGTMFFHIARILEVKRPKIVWLENVKGLLNHDKGETFRVIIQTLSELGYDVQWMVLNSKFHGVPQNRERVFIIGSLRGTSRPEILPFRISNEESNRELMEGQTGSTITSTYHKGNKGTVIGTLDSDGWEKRHEQIRRVWDTNGTAPTIPTAQGGGVMTKIAIPVLTPNREEKRQNGRRFKEDGEESFTLTKTDIHGVSDGMKIRRLTPTECERLQGFPDGWTEGFSDTQRYKMMGNAVTVNVIKALGEKIWKI
jgi:DNA (cytosine-5)-methyltransferase 1